METVDDAQYEVFFELIAAAGTSKSDSMEAIQFAKEGKFEEAHAALAEAEKDMQEAHKIHYELLQNESNGKPVSMNIVAVHAQDHLTMAILTHDMAETIIDLYEKVAAK